jgi:hypothetical protein
MSHYPNSIVQDHLELRATQLHEAAETLPHGDAREALVRRAIRMEAASLIIERWAASRGPRAPR